MDTLIKNNIVQELNNSDKELMNGGGPIFEAIVWLYGFAQGRLEKAAASGAYEKIDWNKQRVLVGG